MKRIFFMLLPVLFLFALFMPADGAPYLYANMPGGAMGGGIGFDLGNGKAIDFCAFSTHSSADSSQSLYADYFWGDWGTAITMTRPSLNGNIIYDLGLQYAIEKDINEKIALGISVNLLDCITSNGSEPIWKECSSFTPYLKLAF